MITKTSPEVGGMGHSLKRKEDLRFIQGRGNYVDDVHLPGMVYGQLVRSPYAHARLKSINTEKAKKLPGVLAVITGEDLAKANLAWMPTLFFDKQMVLATGKVLFQSQEVAFVVAEDRYTAADAAELVEVEYEEFRCWSIRTNRLSRGLPSCARTANRRTTTSFTGKLVTGRPLTRSFTTQPSPLKCTLFFSVAIRRRSKPVAAWPTLTPQRDVSPSTSLRRRRMRIAPCSPLWVAFRKTIFE